MQRNAFGVLLVSVMLLICNCFQPDFSLFLVLGIVVGSGVVILFDKIRSRFGETLQDVINAIDEKTELEEVKVHLGTVYPELEDCGLRAVHSCRDLKLFVRKHCFFTNIRMLESLAERFAKKIPEFEKLLAEFEEAREKLYEQVLAKDFVKEGKEKLRASHAKVLFCHRTYL